MSILDKNTLTKLYNDLGKSDSEIAAFFNFDRTHIVHKRKEYGIKTRMSTGRLGEIKTIEKLVELFGKENIVDMNLLDATSEFDVLLFDKTRIEIKSSMKHRNGWYSFSFSNPENKRIISGDNVILTRTNRTIKRLSNSCDYLILCCIGSSDNNFIILPSNDNRIKLRSTIGIRDFNKYRKNVNNWNLLKNK